MARKSSKTAHVMNLLAGDDSESPKSEAAKENISANLTSELNGTIKELTVLAQQASIQTQDGPLTPTPISIIDMSSSAPDPVAELIKQRLDEEERSDEEEPQSQKEVPSEETPGFEVEESKTFAYEYLNVMEYVVKNKVVEHMEKFDLCPCDRCMADVTALSLTHLPPKYIVVESPSVSPLLNFYSNRFSQQILVELTKACSIVKQNPHH